MSSVSHVCLDAFGRLRIPEEVQRRVGLSPGSVLSIEAMNDREIRLVLDQAPGAEERDGLLVITAVPAVDMVDAIGADRESRMQELWRGVRRPEGTA